MMSKTKRVLALVLAALMAFSLLTACGKSQSSDSSSTPSTSTSVSPSASADPGTTSDVPAEQVTIKWMVIGSSVSDDSDVMAAIEEYLKDKINVKLEMIWGSWADSDSERLLTSLNAGDPIDIYFTCSWTPNEYSAMARKGAFVRLDDPNDNLLEKYAPNLFPSLHPDLARSAVTEGAAGKGIYAIPTYKEVGQQYTWDLNMDMLKKYGYTADDITNYYEFGPILEKIKKGEGNDFYPLNAEPFVMERMANSNDLVDADSLLAFYFDPVDPSKSEAVIKARYLTPEFEKYCKKTREYFVAGYINPAAANGQTMGPARTAAQDAAAYAIGTEVYYPGYEYQTSPKRGIEVVYKPAQAGIISTTSARGSMNGISTASQNPDRALMFLNLLNTDPTLFTMLGYGLEGVHYDKVGEDEVVRRPEGQEIYNPWLAGLGKLTQLPRVQGQAPWSVFEDFNKACTGTPILGFAFDNTPVKDQVAALVNVRKEYADALTAGAVDPDTELPKFIEKLKANGMEEVLAEANRQLEEWKAAK